MGYLWCTLFQDPLHTWIVFDYKGTILRLAETLMDNATVSVTLFISRK